MRVLIVLGLALFTGACGHKPPPSLEVLQARQAKNLEASSRLYLGQSAEMLRKASYAVLSALDPKDMQFDLRQDRLLATRQFWMSGGLSAFSGQQWFEVRLVPEGDGVRVHVAMEQVRETTLISPPSREPSFRQGMAIGSSDGNAWISFALFFDRLEYVLGLQQAWPSCEQAKQRNGWPAVHLCDTWGLSEQPAARQ